MTKYTVTVGQDPDLRGGWKATLFESGVDVGSAAGVNLAEVIRHLYDFARSERLTLAFAGDLHFVLNSKEANTTD